LKFNLLYIFSFNLLLLSACGGKLDPVNPHEEAVAPAQVLAIDPHPESTQNLDEIDRLLKIEDPRTFLENAKGPYLNLKSWQEERVSKNSSFPQFIEMVHSRLLDLPADQRWSELAKHFDSLCQDDLKDCGQLKILKTSPKSAPLLVAVALQQKDVAKKYKFFLMAFDVQNQEFPESTMQEFLNDIKSYRDGLVRSGNKELLARVDRVLSVLFNLYQSGRLHIKDKQWIADLPLLNSIKAEDVAVAAKYSVTEKNGKFTLSPQLQQEIENNQKLPDSFSSRMVWVEKANAKLKAQLKIPVLEKDVYFYVVDQLFTSRWSPKQADAFVKNAGLEISKTFDCAKIYTQSQLAYVMAVAQQELADFLKKTPGLNATNLFVDSKKALSHSSIAAKALPDHFRNVLHFFSLSAPKSPEDQSYFKIVNLLEKTVKMTVSYPVALVLFDTATRLGITPNQLVSLDGQSKYSQWALETYVQQFIRGEVDPLLDYTIDKHPLSSFEVIEAVEMTAKSGWYESMGRTPDEALRDLFEVYMQSNAWKVYFGQVEQSNVPTKLAVLKDSLQTLEAKFNAGEWQDTVHLCKGFQSANSKPRQTLNLLSITESPTLGSLAKRISYPENASRISGGTGNTSFEYTEPGYFMFSRKTMDQIEWLRLDILPTLQFFSALQQGLEKSGLKTPLFAQSLENVKQLSKTYAVKFMKRFREAQDCYFLLMTREREVMSQLVIYEKAYWQWAHGQIAAGHDINSLFAKNLPNGMSYRTQITAGKVVTYTWDLLLRLKVYLESGLPQLKMPAIAPNLSIVIPDSLIKNPLYMESQILQVPVGTDAGSFATTVLREGGLTGDNRIVDWFLNSYMDIISLKSYEDATVLFYRASPIFNQVLGLPNYFTLQESFDSVPRIRRFLSLSQTEFTSQAMIGLQSRFISDFLESGDQLLQQGGTKPHPIYDHVLKALASNWMGGFADDDAWENSEMRTQRPPSIVPIAVKADKLFQYQLDSQFQIFSATSNARALMMESFKTTIHDDLQVVSAFANKVENESKPIEVLYNNVGPLQADNYSSVFLKNVRTVVDKINLRTGGMYK
jgi:hypothetical protein